MSRMTMIVAALVGVALIVWWALTDFWVPLGLLAVLLLLVGVGVVKATSGPGTIGRAQDKTEGQARAGFPRPPEQRGQ